MKMCSEFVVLEIEKRGRRREKESKTGKGMREGKNGKRKGSGRGD